MARNPRFGRPGGGRRLTSLAAAAIVIGGGGIVAPILTLGLSATAPSVAANAVAGTLVSNITNVPAGVTPSVNPNDGRLVIAGDASAGWKVVVGLSALSAGSINFSVAATGATGASRVLTVTAAVATPDGAFEAVISPPVTYARSTFLLTKQGVTAVRDPEMGSSGNGVYWNSGFKLPSAAYPNRRIHARTTDHTTGAGGLFYSVSIGDPSVPANIKVYADAVAAGWLDDFPTKPAANPVFIGAQNAGDNRQMETARIRKYGSTYVLTYQLGAPIGSKSGGTYRDQATLRAISTDGINWVRGNNIALLEIPAGLTIGKGHTGYSQPYPNPYDNVINPSTGQRAGHILYSQASGTDQGLAALWACEDPIAGDYTFVTALHSTGGRASPAGALDNRFRFAWNSIDLTSAHRVRQGVAVLMTARSQASGDAAAPGDLYLCLLAHDGVTMLGKPQLALARGGTGAFDAGEVGWSDTSIFGEKYVVNYMAGDAGGEKRGGVATGPLRHPENTFFELLKPLTPTSLTTKTANFKGASGIPAGFELVTVGTTPPVPTYSAAGITFPLDGTQATPSEAYIYESTGFDPATTDYVDFYLKDWITRGGPANRIPFIGFATAKSAKAAQTDAIWLSNGEGTAFRAYWQQLVASAAPLPRYLEPYHYGVGGPATTGDNTRDNALKAIGMRWFPMRDRLFLLGEGGVEMEELNTPDGNYAGNLDKTKRYYPVAGFRGSGAAACLEGLGSFTVNYGNTAAPALTPASVGTVTRAVSGADGNTYNFPAMTLGTAGRNGGTAFFIGGYAALASTDLQASLTLTDGTIVPLTRLSSLRTSTYATNQFANGALFGALLPNNALVADVNAAITGSQWTRATCMAFELRDIANIIPAFVSTGEGTRSVGGTATNPMSVSIGSDVGGIAIMGSMFGTTTATFAYSASTSFTRRNQPIVVTQGNNLGTATTTGIASTGAGTQMEAIAGGGGIIIAAAWEPAA